jgi:hypothetical protein
METSELILAAYLRARGFRVRAEREDPRAPWVTFIVDDPTADVEAATFYAGQALVEPRTYHRALGECRTLMRNA